MNSDDKIKQLEEYRARALEELVGMSDYLINSDGISYETLISLARSSGRIDLFEKVLEKIRLIEDKGEKSDALLAYLDEVEFAIADSIPGQQDDTGVEPDEFNQDANDNNDNYNNNPN